MRIEIGSTCKVDSMDRQSQPQVSPSRDFSSGGCLRPTTKAARDGRRLAQASYCSHRLSFEKGSLWGAERGAKGETKVSD